MLQTGWLALNPREQSPVFIPHKQQKITLPSTLPAQIGKKMKAMLPVSHSTVHATPSPRYMPTRIIQVAPDQYRVGPFVAILTSADRRTPFRGNSLNFADLIRMGRKMGITVFVLTPEGIKPSRSTVKGYLLDPRFKTNKWVLGTLPMPDVIYNRIPYRSFEERPLEQQALKMLNELNIPIFNPSFFNKWTLYKLLRRSSSLTSLLPDTTPWSHIDRCKQLIKKHPVLYLKPVDGKAGIGMIRINKQNDAYDVVYQTKSSQKKYQGISNNTLFSFLNKLIQSHEYILQQGISLALYRDRPFDLRLLAQKDNNGKWGVTGIGTRLAGKEAISTHVPRGGSIEDTTVVLSEVFGTHHPYIYKKAEKIGIKIAKHIEVQSGQSLGEMSMDMGVDKEGEIWFFEANSKPMKFDEPQIRQLSLQRILQYSLYISGYQPQGEGE
ncbi:YheC/YheD family protein [Mechercharimyces sp. CAU 1602]|nr:YheC/YheD family protein [Mechercharimyces sp. CAU 1602]